MSVGSTRAQVESGGIDVLQDVVWPTGDTGSLVVAALGPGAPAGFTFDGRRIEGRLPAEGAVVPFMVDYGQNATGEPATAWGLLRIPAFDDYRLQGRNGYGIKVANLVEARGDLPHHLIEDVAITLGVALHDETPEACTRYADATVVMDEAMVQVALDLGGRSYYEGPLPSSLYDHFLRSLAENARMTLHVRVLRGTDRHHVVEAAFKALGLALAKAVAPGDAVFSTKGSVKLERRRLA